MVYEVDILKEIRSQLPKYFKDIEVVYDEVFFTCPFHKDGQEKHPSCSVNIDTKSGVCHKVYCFTCQKSTDLAGLISYVFDYDDNGEFGRKYLRGYRDYETRGINIEVNRTGTKKIFIQPEQIEKYMIRHPYMYKRKLTDEVLDKYLVGYDKINNNLVFPVRDRLGNIVALTTRNVDTKFFSLPSTLEKPVYGLYELPRGSNICLVCEGAIDALTSTGWGMPALALFGTGTKDQFNAIKKMGLRTIISGFDNDFAGNQAHLRLKASLGKCCEIVRLTFPDGCKDINDMTKEQFLSHLNAIGVD